MEYDKPTNPIARQTKGFVFPPLILSASASSVDSLLVGRLWQKTDAKERAPPDVVATDGYSVSCNAGKARIGYCLEQLRRA